MAEITHKKLTVIYLSHYSNLYGANRSLIDLITGIKKINENFYPIVITTEKGDLTIELAGLSVPCIIVPFYNSIINVHENRLFALIKSLLKQPYNFYLLLKNYLQLRRLQADVIHSNTSVFIWGIWLSLMLKKPHVQHIREFGKEDYNFKYDFGMCWYNYWLNKSKVVIAISKSIYNKRLQRCHAAIKQVIYNGVVFSSALNNAEVNCPGNKISNKRQYTFGIVGNISTEKEQHTAIEAVYLLHSYNRNIRLIIAGTGSDNYVSVLQHKIREFSLESNVRFTGFVTDVESIFKEMDCLLMCSANEAFGRVTVEAMSFGIPVIGYDNAGTAEIIKDGYNGLLYKQGSEELSKKMMKVMNNKELAQTICSNGLKTVEQHYTIEKYANSVYNLYTT